MSVELISVLIAVLAIGATLAGLIVSSNRGLRQDIRQDMARLESRLDERINGLESQISELRERMAHEIGELRERMAKLEGLLEIDGEIKTPSLMGNFYYRYPMSLSLEPQVSHSP